MTAVWEDSRAANGSLLVLLCLADHANDEGRCWPSLERLAKRARLSERQVRRVLDALVELGEIELPTGGVGPDSPIVLAGHFVTGHFVPDAGHSAQDAVTKAVARVEPSVEPSKEPSDAQTSLLASPVAELWEHYRHVIPEGQSRYNGERKAELRAALKVRDLETCKRAVEGLRVSAHHNGQNDAGQKWLELKYAIGKAGKPSVGDRIDTMAAKAPAQSAGGLVSLQALLARFSASERELVSTRTLEVKRWAEDESPDAGLTRRKDEAARWLAQYVKVEPVFEGGSLRGFRQL